MSSQRYLSAYREQRFTRVCDVVQALESFDEVSPLSSPLQGEQVQPFRFSSVQFSQDELWLLPIGRPVYCVVGGWSWLPTLRISDSRTSCGRIQTLVLIVLLLTVFWRIQFFSERQNLHGSISSIVALLKQIEGADVI